MGLFAILEQTLRWATSSKKSDSFHTIITKIQGSNTLSEDQIKKLDRIRDVRNKYFHSDFHANTFIIDNISYPISENTTSEYFYNNLSHDCFDIIHSLLSSTS